MRKTAAWLIALYFAFILVSFWINFESGKEIGKSFFDFIFEMLKILPFVLIIIGLFEVWVKKETIEKHLGEDSGPLAYLWAVILAGFIIGGIYVAFPIAVSLYRKGIKLSVLLTFLSASAVTRIQLTLFEASFLGMKFTLIRLAVSLPLIIISSIFLASHLTGRNYKIPENKD